MLQIDVDDWRAHTEYSGFEADDEAVAWFWAAVEEMSQEDRAMLLRFVTGSPRAPLGGTKKETFYAWLTLNRVCKLGGGAGRYGAVHDCEARYGRAPFAVGERVVRLVPFF